MVLEKTPLPFLHRQPRLPAPLQHRSCELVQGDQRCPATHEEAQGLGAACRVRHRKSNRLGPNGRWPPPLYRLPEDLWMTSVWTLDPLCQDRSSGRQAASFEGTCDVTVFVNPKITHGGNSLQRRRCIALSAQKCYSVALTSSLSETKWTVQKGSLDSMSALLSKDLFHPLEKENKQFMVSPFEQCPSAQVEIRFNSHATYCIGRSTYVFEEREDARLHQGEELLGRRTLGRFWGPFSFTKVLFCGYCTNL